MRRIALTGGPGAGKTAVLEVVRRHFYHHVLVLPESAGILFGGFPRRDGEPARRAAQRAIYRVQVELERMALEDGHAKTILCDRGTVDPLAYWPGPASFWEDVGSDLDTELARYSAVIHLRTPPANGGYDHANPVRTETAEEARKIDDRILEAWARHPTRIVIDSQPTFLEKLRLALDAIHRYVPELDDP